LRLERPLSGVAALSSTIHAVESRRIVIMPASRRSQSKSSRTARAHPTPAGDAVATPDDTGSGGDAAATAGAPADSAAPDTAPAPVEEVPLNRAARRAKGGAASQQQGYGPGKVSGGKGPVSNHRMWANRRSG
jgi:hypothetical protein